jgi:hypothetical protein
MTPRLKRGVFACDDRLLAAKQDGILTPEWASLFKENHTPQGVVIKGLKSAKLFRLIFRHIETIPSEICLFCVFVSH